MHETKENHEEEIEKRAREREKNKTIKLFHIFQKKKINVNNTPSRPTRPASLNLHIKANQNESNQRLFGIDTITGK